MAAALVSVAVAAAAGKGEVASSAVPCIAESVGSTVVGEGVGAGAGGLGPGQEHPLSPNLEVGFPSLFFFSTDFLSNSIFLPFVLQLLLIYLSFSFIVLLFGIAKARLKLS